MRNRPSQLGRKLPFSGHLNERQLSESVPRRPNVWDEGA